MKTLSLIFLHAIFLCCVSLPFSKALGILGNETDRLALLASKSQITHDPFEVLSSWNDSNHFCEWGGINCSHRHQRAISLDLNSKGLVEIISPHIGNLSFLRKLNLLRNDFHGEIPQEIGKLFRLETLWLANNSFVGKIPRNISFCSNLISLILSGNNFFGNIPMEVWSLPKLRGLVVESANLTGKIPPSLGNITSLKVLALSYNHFGGIIPNTLGQLKSLYLLNLVANGSSLPLQSVVLRSFVHYT
ncbi:non-specific serine/threonine protein kinase [Ranunculus cassubicifolius]